MHYKACKEEVVYTCGDKLEDHLTGKNMILVEDQCCCTTLLLSYVTNLNAILPNNLNMNAHSIVEMEQERQNVLHE